MSHRQEQPQQPHDVESIRSLGVVMASAMIGSAAAVSAASVVVAADDSQTQSGNTNSEFCTKGPKKVTDPGSKSASKLRQPNGGGGVQVASSLPLSYTSPQTPGLTSSVSSSGWSPMPSQPPPLPPVSEEDNDDAFFAQIFDSPLPVVESGRPEPGSAAQVIITMPPPSPRPPPLPQLPLKQQVQTQPTASSSSQKQKAGPPVSLTTRDALIKKLQSSQVSFVDENFNTQLHNAVLQNQPAVQMDFLLSDLQNRKRLLPIINLVNCNGHTPLSLCLKFRRADLIPLLLRFDAAPTQLCGNATERSNHFHYAMARCLDTPQSLDMVRTFTSEISKHCLLDLSGLLAKNRQGKTAMDFLALRILQLRSGQQDSASTELLSLLQSLLNWLNSQLGATG